jgi:RNA polymerase sigma-70 factor (ECF subfamily)
MSAYRSFFVAARDGRIALTRSGDLWRLLVAITLHKLYRQVRKHEAASRSVDAESLLIDSELLAREPPPEEVVGVADELEHLLARLDPLARRVLELRLQDHILAVIAEQTGRSERTIRRTLATIRDMLNDRALL